MSARIIHHFILLGSLAMALPTDSVIFDWANPRETQVSIEKQIFDIESYLTWVKIKKRPGFNLDAFEMLVDPIAAPFDKLRDLRLQDDTPYLRA